MKREESGARREEFGIKREECGRKREECGRKREECCENATPSVMEKGAHLRGENRTKIELK
jgi:hypothetical protein